MSTVQEMVTSLPTVSSATMQDIIMAVQGYVSPSELGLSVQENLGQVYQLFQSNIILYNLGNPNGEVAGNTYQFCWDTIDNILWICTTTGTSSTAVWTKVIQLTAGAGIEISQAGNDIVISSTSMASSFVVVSSVSQQMVSNTTYQANYFGQVNFVLPTTSVLGDTIQITGFGAGGWKITQNPGQNIQIGQVSTTVTTGSVASTNQYDGISLTCVSANTTWQNISGPQSEGLTII